MKEMNPAMKKTIAWILALAMLSASAMALAENTLPQMPSSENRQPPEMPDGQKPGNPPDGGMGGPGGPGGQSGKPESYDAVTTVSADTEISGETIESTGKDENALLVTGGTATVMARPMCRATANIPSPSATMPKPVISPARAKSSAGMLLSCRCKTLTGV